MIHDEFREARLAAGLTVSEVARRAGVPRKQVQALEGGANVTLQTVRQIAPVIPNLHRVTLGGLEIVAANVDLDEARRAALELFDVSKRLVAALGGMSAPKAPERTAAATVRHHADASVQDIDPQLLQKLELLVDDILRQREEQGALQSAERPDA